MNYKVTIWNQLLFDGSLWKISHLNKLPAERAVLGLLHPQLRTLARLVHLFTILSINFYSFVYMSHFTCSSCSIWPSITAKRKIHLNLIIIEIHVIILQLSIKMFTNTFGKEVEGHLSVLLALCSQFSWYWTSNPQALVSSLGVILF